MKEKHRRGIWLSLVLLHLFFVSLSACYIKIADWIPFSSLITLYQRASGSDAGYGFFAPSIDVKSRAVFDIVDHNGDKRENLPLVPDSQREAQIRVNAIVDELTVKDVDDPEYRQPIAASLAAAMFGKHRDAKEVVLHIQELWPKTMEEYREGQRADWSNRYSARFVRGANRNEGGN